MKSASGWWCNALRGWIATEVGQHRIAGDAFDSARAYMPDTLRCMWDDLSPVLGMAPAVWKDLPDPDAIFIGGTGRKVHDIVAAAMLRLKPGGRIVAAMGSIENVAEVHEALNSATGDARVWLLQFSRGNAGRGSR